MKDRKNRWRSMEREMSERSRVATVNRGPRTRQRQQGRRSEKRRRRVEATTGVGKRRQLARVYTTALCSRRPHRTISLSLSLSLSLFLSRVEQSERFYLSEHLFPFFSLSLSSILSSVPLPPTTATLGHHSTPGRGIITTLWAKWVNAPWGGPRA